MKNVLIITYYWPPAGGSGVRRWLNFSNQFHNHNWQPVIFRPLNANYPSKDLTLSETIDARTKLIGSNITEPFNLYAKFLGKKGISNNPGVLFKNENPGLKEKLSVWVRSNIFIPDARMLWIRPSVMELNNYLKQNKVDLIISTGPPHTTHIIAKKISRKFQIPWIADFRDPWTKIDFFHKLTLSKYALNKHLRLESEVLIESSAQTTVSWSWGKDFETLGAKNVHVITNGFDLENFASLDKKLDDEFTITHLGSMNDDRNHSEFWKAVQELVEENSEFKNSIKIKLIGDIVPSVSKEIEANCLKTYCEHIPFMTHPEAMQSIANSRVLYLPLNNTPHVGGIVPGKVFEYLAVKRPILAIGPSNGDTAKILYAAENGIICNFGDFEKIKESIRSLFSNYQMGKDKIASDNYEKFSRAGLTKQMVDLMNEVTSK